MVKITCDSTADLDTLFAERNIGVLPLVVTLGNDSFFDGVDVTPPDIFRFVKEKGVLPKTAARSETDFYEFFRKYTEQGDSVLHSIFRASFRQATKWRKKRRNDWKTFTW